MGDELSILSRGEDRFARSRHNSYGRKTQDRSVTNNNSTADAIFGLVMLVLFFTLPAVCSMVVGAI